MNRAEMEDAIFDLLSKRYDEKESMIGPEIMRDAERMIMLNVIDNQWKDHLLSMDHLKEGIGLRGYGQKDPLIEYKKESFELFQDMMERIEDETLRYLYFLQVTHGEDLGPSNGAARPVLPFDPDEEWVDDEEEEAEPVPVAAAVSAEQQRAVMDFTRNIQRKKERELEQLQMGGAGGPSVENKPVVSANKTGRNDPCPCGSGKKYKKCHGA
jgi:preprotein translocase subunit SecA